MFTDDSECLENNYCTKTIDAKIPCENCKNRVRKATCDIQLEWEGDKRVWKYFKTIEDMYKSCPLPTEPIRCASCGTVLGQNAPTLESRVEKLEKTVFIPVEDTKKRKCKGCYHLVMQGYNDWYCSFNVPKVSPESDCVKDKWIPVQMSHRAIHGADTDRINELNTENKALQSENARLKELHKNAVEFNVKKLAEINQLQSELESLKKNQLSINKDELIDIIVILQDKMNKHPNDYSHYGLCRIPALLAKLQSMVGEK